ncbi:hypothetical protein CBOM_07686 [Ceraceosorus bombacis]|uniref:Uncharacterized protein n=1 Tax=Ceraceosorus bombacis TaxID=401625 RepID=A0A0P1BB86_9BASI|nr:hypothetical protein CBOM_07686 [Ceraceosorus bombacis]
MRSNRTRMDLLTTCSMIHDPRFILYHCPLSSTLLPKPHSMRTQSSLAPNVGSMPWLRRNSRTCSTPRKVLLPIAAHIDCSWSFSSFFHSVSRPPPPSTIPHGS